MNIKIKFKGDEYDLSPFVSPGTVQIRRTIDSTLDSGSFVIPKIAADAMAGIDMSRPIPRYCDCSLEKDGKTFYFLISESEVAENKGLYTHNVTLISRSKILTMRTLPDMTLTQHSLSSSPLRGSENKSTNAVEQIKVSCGSYVNSDTLDPFFYPQAGGDGIKLTTSDKPLAFSSIGTENDYVNGMTLKKAGQEYSITFAASAINPQINFEVTSLWGALTTAWAMHADAQIILDIYVNGIKHSEIIRYDIPPASPQYVGSLGANYPANAVIASPVPLDKSIKYTTSGTNEVISFKARVEGQYFYKHYLGVDEWQDDILFLKDVAVYISTDAEGATPFAQRKADELVDKIISLSEYPMTQSAPSRARLQNIVAPEATLTSYDAWQAMLYVGSFSGSVPRLVYNGVADEMVFDFYDDLESGAAQDFINIQEKKTKNFLEGYTAAVELNAENILRNNKGSHYPSFGGFVGVRAEGKGQQQISTNNLSIHTPYPIDKLYKVIVKGIPVYYENDVIAFSKDEQWDITDRVLPKEHYDILINQSNYDNSARRGGVPNTNNMLYYIQGQSDIMGLSSIGSSKPELWGTGTNRAIREIIYCLAAKESPTAVLKKYHDNGSTQEDAEIGVYVEYEPYISTRARIYKEDQSGFEKPLVTYLNENARVNDATALGNYAQSEVNRSANTIQEVKGICQLAQIPEVGSKNSDGYVLTEVQLLFYGSPDNRVAYYGKYSKDFSVISEFIGLKSEYRIWEVPKTNIVLSTRRFARKIYLSKSALPNPQNGHGFYLTQKNSLIGTAPIAAIFETDAQPGKKFILNADNSAFGNTIVCNVRAYDNYSVGSQRITTLIGGEQRIMQQDCRYTNDFGRMSKFNLTYKFSISPQNIGESGALAEQMRALYPQIDVALNMSSYAYPALQNIPYDKDARETFSFNYETTYLSDNIDEIFVYTGFTRYHSLVRPAQQEGGVLCAVVDYIPSKSATIIDRGKILGWANASTSGSTLTVGAGTSGQGFAFYNRDTFEMLLFIKSNGLTVTIHFGEKE